MWVLSPVASGYTAFQVSLPARATGVVQMQIPVLLATLTGVMLSQAAWPQTLLLRGQAQQRSFMPATDSWIECGETEETDTMSAGHASLLFWFQAEVGDVISLKSVGDNTAMQIVSPDGALSDLVTGEGTTVICNTRIATTGVHTLLYSVGGSDPLFYLTMFCGAAPPACTTSVSPGTWTQVKVLFR